MRILADVRALQDPAYACRGIGSHAAFLLRRLRAAAIGGRGIVGLVDPGLGPLAAEHSSLLDEIRPAFVRDRIDEPTLFLSLSPLTHDSLLPARLLDRQHVVAIAAVYDFIPLRFPDRYLAGRDALFAYAAAYRWLEAYHAFLPISGCCGEELVRRFGVSSERVSVTGVALREAFARLMEPGAAAPPRPDGAAEESLLFVGGDDPRKNLETVVAGHARLVAQGREGLQLVVGGGYPDARQRRIREESRARAGRATDIRFLDLVGDEELAAWYAHAAATVVASLDEGFSIPVIEAIAAGGVAVVSDIPAHRELVDDTDAVFPPTDAADLARKLEAILGSPAVAGRLRATQRPAAERFTPEAVAGRFEEAVLRHVASFRDRRPAARPRGRPAVAVVTPFPPDRSGVADYSKKCVESLSRYVDVDVFTDAREPAANPAVRAYHPISPAAWLRPDYDAVVAVVGNSRFHTKILDLHRRFGGACIMHDNRLAELTARWKGEEHVRRIAERSLGRDVRSDEVRRWLERPEKLPTLFYDELIERASPLIVHSAGIRTHAERLYGIDAVQLPFCVYRDFDEREISPGAKRAARDAVGIPQDRRVVVTLGIVDAVKRPAECVQAIALLRERGTEAHLHFVGKCAGGLRESLATLAASRRVGDLVHFSHDWIPEEDYRRFIVAADAGIQLRAHFFGGISGALVDCAAAGLPTVANEDLAAAIEAPSYVERVTDRAEPGRVAEAVAACLAVGGDRRRHDRERTAFARAHSFDAYSRRLLTCLLGPSPAWTPPRQEPPPSPAMDPLRRLLVAAPPAGRPAAIDSTARSIERVAEREGISAARVVVRKGRLAADGTGGPVEVDGGDVLLLPDGLRTAGGDWPAVEQARVAGARIVTILHEPVPARRSAAAVIAHSDLIVTTSEQSARDLAAEMPSFRFPRRGPAVVPWTPACDPHEPGDESAGRLLAVIRDGLSPGPLPRSARRA